VRREASERIPGGAYSTSSHGTADARLPDATQQLVADVKLVIREHKNGRKGLKFRRERPSSQRRKLLQGTFPGEIETVNHRHGNIVMWQQSPGDGGHVSLRRSVCRVTQVGGGGVHSKA
jgi:hypothetical protein